ncbi:MAG: T9SS type A sorting domain-containing protein, partial [Bacteroidota bacterium]
YFPSYASITMYPNPARSMATFEATGLQRGEYTLKVHNIVGRRLFSQNFSSTGSIKADIDVNSLPSGIYLYSLTNARGRILATKRLLVSGLRP